jgi:phospholipase A1/A2
MRNKVVVPARQILRLFQLLLVTLSLPMSGSAQTNANAITTTNKPPFDAVTFFKDHIFPHEPMYFIAGSKDPNAKFQFGFKYQIADTDYSYLSFLDGFYFAYTQTSLWDLSAPSAPFFDSSYKPELLYSYDNLIGGGPTNWFRLDAQLGAQHESNGKDGVDSRSLNIAYFRPTFVLGYPTNLHFTLQPRVWAYIGDVGEFNADINEYRGYFDLRAMITYKDIQLSAHGRAGKDWDNFSIQVDLTYRIPNTGIYLDVQYYTGYGESLLLYNERSDVLRAGIALYR